jgi:hypothetical protein
MTDFQEWKREWQPKIQEVTDLARRTKDEVDTERRRISDLWAELRAFREDVRKDWETWRKTMFGNGKPGYVSETIKTELTDFEEKMKNMIESTVTKAFKDVADKKEGRSWTVTLLVITALVQGLQAVGVAWLIWRVTNPVP